MMCAVRCMLHGRTAGGEGAPDLTESLQNLAINSTAVVVLGALLYRDFAGKQKALKVTDREESLSRLQVGWQQAGSRQLELELRRIGAMATACSGGDLHAVADMPPTHPLPSPVDLHGPNSQVYRQRH